MKLFVLVSSLEFIVGCYTLSDTGCNRVDNAQINYQMGNEGESAQYTVSLPIGVCTETYLLPIDLYNVSDMPNNNYNYNDNDNTEMNNFPSDQETTLFDIGTLELSVFDPINIRYKHNAGLGYWEISNLNDIDSDLSIIKSFNFVCDYNNDAVYYQAFWNSSNCHGASMFQQIKVNSTSFHCTGAAPCDYSVIEQYQTFPNSDKCDHTKYYTGLSVVTDYCMQLGDPGTGSLANASSIFTCKRKNIYEAVFNGSSTCGSDGDNYFRSINLTNGCNMINFGNESYYQWIEIDC